MYSNTVRIILIIIAALVAIFFGTVGLWLQMGAAIAFIVLMALGYFLNGAVYLAFRKLGKNDFDRAEELLKMTKYPQYLGRTQKAYYYFITGCIEANKENLQPAANAFETALRSGLRTENDKAIAMLNLASIFYSLGQTERAIKYLEATKLLKYSPGLQPEVDNISQLLANG